MQGGFASPVADADRLYLVDNAANLLAHAASGRQLWSLKLGTIQKASPLLADGKLYVGTENGRFFIVQPGPDKGQMLDEDWLGRRRSPSPCSPRPSSRAGASTSPA